MGVHTSSATKKDEWPEGDAITSRDPDDLWEGLKLFPYGGGIIGCGSNLEENVIYIRKFYSPKAVQSIWPPRPIISQHFR